MKCKKVVDYTNNFFLKMTKYYLILCVIEGCNRK